MKIFAQQQVRDALAYAAAGGVALHICDGSIADAVAKVRRVPNCFRGRKEFAHMFGKDAELLKRIARHCGVRVLFIDRGDTPAQHIDLVGGPLERAKELFGHAVCFPESDPALLTRRMYCAWIERAEQRRSERARPVFRNERQAQFWDGRGVREL